MALLDERVLHEWQTRWDDDDEPGRVTHKFIPDVQFVFSRRDFRFSLHAGFLLTGHGSLNAYLHRIGRSETPACICGADREDSLHVLCVCPIYADLRDLDGLGVENLHGVWRVTGAVESE
ncbi:hypothetical protein KR044_006743, partial [Drosophila immigrans]